MVMGIWAFEFAHVLNQESAKSCLAHRLNPDNCLLLSVTIQSHPFVKYCLWLFSCYNTVGAVETKCSTKLKICTLSPFKENPLISVLNSIFFFTFSLRGKLASKDFSGPFSLKLTRIFPTLASQKYKQNHPKSRVEVASYYFPISE